MPLKKLPEQCTSSKPLEVGHTLSCKRRGFITNSQNSVGDITVNPLQEVTNEIQIKPTLEPRTGEIFSNAKKLPGTARADIAVRNVWIRSQRPYFNMRVFNPHLPR